MVDRSAQRAWSCACVALPLLVAGCGSLPDARLPPPAVAAAPPAAAGPGLLARVDGRARRLVLRDARTGAALAAAPAGVDPTAVACAPPRWCYVTDMGGDGLLVFRLGGGGRRLELVRRVHLPGAPLAVALDQLRRRLWVAAPGRRELVELPAHGRPHVLTRRRVRALTTRTAYTIAEAAANAPVSAAQRPR